MSSKSHRRGNDSLRERLCPIIDPLAVGTEVRTEEIVTILQALNRKYEIDAFRASRLLRERDDLKWIRGGTFLKVAVAVHAG